MSLIDLLYSNAPGRAALKLALDMGVPKMMAGILCSPMSRHLIPLFVEKYGIDLTDFVAEHYDCFADFFVRRKLKTPFDAESSHFISPCESNLSAFPISRLSGITIKGSHYRLCDILGDAKLADDFRDGLCLVFRLTVSDYHRYIFMDDGYSHESHFIEGELHSVQPISCESFPVYRLNRRWWTLLETEHFGPIVQTEIGAMAVGGVVNEKQNAHFQRGEERGRFEIRGSTIVLLLKKDTIRLRDDIVAALKVQPEIKVGLGEWIGTKI